MKNNGCSLDKLIEAKKNSVCIVTASREGFAPDDVNFFRFVRFTETLLTKAED